MLAAFIGGANRQSLAADLESGAYQSLLIRVALLLLAAVFLGLRIGFRLTSEKNVRPAHLLLITLFCGLLFYPLVSHTSFAGRSFSKVIAYLQRVQEKTSASTLTLVRQFPATYEKYWQDNSILSKAYIHLNAMVKIYLFKVSPNTTVALGKKGFYFEGYGARKVEKGVVEKFDNIADYMGMFPFSEWDLWKWKLTLEERSYWLKKQGIEYVFVLAPTKALVYPEFLPQSLQNLKKGQRRYDQLSAYLKDNANIHFVDLLPAMLKEKRIREYPLLFYRTDFHWNYYGSLVAYQEVIRKMQTFFPEYPLTPVTLDDFTVKIDKHWAHHRFMNMIGLPVRLHKNEHYLTLVPKPGTPLYKLEDLPSEGIHDVYPPKGMISNSQGETMSIRMVRNPAAPIQSILLLGDSFLEKCVYFFSANAKEVWNYRTIVNFPTQIFAYEKPTFVIQEILNMFILRQPPENPSAIRQEYLASQFELSAKQDQSRKEIDKKNIKVSIEDTKIFLPGLAKKDNSSYIARIRLASQGSGSLEVKIRKFGGKEIFWTEEQVDSVLNTLYVSIPPRSMIHELVLRWKKKGRTVTSVMVESVSLCSM